MYQTRLNLDPEEPLDKRVVLISDPEWDNCIQEWREQRVFGVDIETYGLVTRKGKKKFEEALDPIKGKIRLIQIGLLSDQVLVANLGGWGEDYEARLNQYSQFLEILKEKMEDKKIIKVGQNIKYEMTFLMWKFGIHTRNVRDTMLMSQTLWAIGGSGDKYLHNLGAIAERTGFEVSKAQQKSDWGGELSNSQINYAALDAYVVLPIAMELKKRLVVEELWETAMVENDSCPAFAEMEYYGLPIDESILDELLDTYTTEADKAISVFINEFPINPRSPQQVNNALNTKYKLGLEPVQKERKSDSKNKMILMENTHIPAVDSLILFRSLGTQIGTYFKSIKDNIYNGVVRSSYRQIGGDDRDEVHKGRGTGRSSSRDPNLQNAANLAPKWEELGLKHPRSAFKVPAGYRMIVADLSQAHMRIATEFSQDRVLIDAYNDDRDIHAITASAQAQTRGLGLDWTPENILKWRKDKNHPNSMMAEVLRKTSKNVNYGSLNAQGALTLQKTMAISRDPVFVPISECKEMIYSWRGIYNKLSDTHKKIYDNANSYDFEFPGLPGKFGMTIGLSGRKVYFQKTLQDRRVDGEREVFWSVKYTDCISSIWLGTEAHIIKRSMTLLLDEMDKHPEWEWHIGNMAHDEIDTIVKEEYAEDAARLTVQIMDNCMREFIKSIPVNEPNYDPLTTICNSWSEK